MTLTKRQLEVVKLKEEGLTHNEIAARLGISRGTSEQTLWQARIKLQATKRVKSKATL